MYPHHFFDSKVSKFYSRQNFMENAGADGD